MQLSEFDSALGESSSGSLASGFADWARNKKQIAQSIWVGWRGERGAQKRLKQELNSLISIKGTHSPTHTPLTASVGARRRRGI